MLQRLGNRLSKSGSLHVPVVSTVVTTTRRGSQTLRAKTELESETHATEMSSKQANNVPFNNVLEAPFNKEGLRSPESDDELKHLKLILHNAVIAQRRFSTYTQVQVDEIFKAAAAAACAQRIPLAIMAVEETKMGVVEDKVIKNHFASEFIYNKYKNQKTCDVIEVDSAGGMTKIAEPVGVIAGIVPTTNPTSTAIFKALLTLKTRNALILCPHPRATKATIAAAKIVLVAAVAAGAPPGIISWVDHPSMVVSQALMQAPEISLILATGGPAMVKAAYSSGHPSVGVGAGNTPAVIDETANIQMAVSSILLSKTFDNGVICASEQSVVVHDQVYEDVKAEFSRRGAYFLTEEEKARVRSKIMIEGKLNASIVGQSVQKLAQIFGITVPPWTRVIIGEIGMIGKEEPLSEEKLCPLLGMYRAADYDSAVDMADRLVRFAGPGHTSVLYTNPLNRDHIDRFGSVVKTVRVLINTPASQGAIGDLYNFHLDPSLTLGCGTWGSTSVSSNVGPMNLLNIKSVTERRENIQWFRVPPKIYFKGGCLETALMDLKGRKRALIVTDKPIFDLGYIDRVTRVLDTINCHYQVFYQVQAEPTMACVREGVQEANRFRPDTIIAIGGGSPMDAAKAIWLMYEQPETELQGLAMRFMDIRKRVFEIPSIKRTSNLVCIPTSSGTGSEVTPFAVLTDETTGQKHPLVDYAMTPRIAIVDPQLVTNLPQPLTAYGGFDALTHALESYVSVMATDYTKGLSREAAILIFKFLPRAYHDGQNDLLAREKMHYATSIAGMAFANAFLGICHSMAHAIGSEYHIPQGAANAVLLSHVVRYNATDVPFRQAAFPQYEYAHAKADYAELSDALGLGGTSEEDKVIRLIEAIEELKANIGIPPTIRELMQSVSGVRRVSDAEYQSALDAMAVHAVDNQHTGTNPRAPLVSDLRQIMEDGYDAPIIPVNSLDFFSKV